MSWNWKYLGLIIFATFLNYFTGICIDKSKNINCKRLWLIISLIGSLSVLGVFKYYNFFIDNIMGILPVFGLTTKLQAIDVLLPVGISFYTFQCLSYTIDIYREEIKPTRNIGVFALYVSFFPQLVAGPIVRAKDLLPQLIKSVSYNELRVLNGLLLIFVGLFKKICIADVLSTIYVDKVFASPELFCGPEILLAIYGYAIQIYCDFSGYSDIAVGVGKTLGYELPINFNSPYLARDIRDFWRRWHISLSTWIRDYLYFPLGGDKRGKIRTFGNLMTTMLLAGLWHGAAWKFVIWGGYHGILLVLNHCVKNLLRENSNRKNNGVRRIIEIFITFNLVCLGWLIFRSPNIETFTVIVKRLFIWPSHAIEISGIFLLALTIGFITHFIPRELKSLIQRKYITIPAVLQGCVYAMTLIVFTAFSSQGVPFIYFQF